MCQSCLSVYGLVANNYITCTYKSKSIALIILITKRNQVMLTPQNLMRTMTKRFLMSQLEMLALETCNLAGVFASIFVLLTLEQVLHALSVQI